MLGKGTIDTRTRGITKGQHGSSNTNYQNAGRELLTLDEVRLLDNSNALIFIRGERPLIDKKFDILSHPNVAKTADGKAVPYKHSKSEKYLRNDLSFTINEDLSNIKLLEVDGDNVKAFDFANPQTKQNEILEVTDNEKSEHAENNSENSESTENSPQG
ncbi:MAG: type IV secretory system conjugative DNA transfer family protein [Clostridiales bacterium]|nr:type IV secretory system conjugative DNA transfer family protein [Clostridiales bacterium]